MGLFNNNTGANKGGGLRNIYNTIKPSLNLSADQETKIDQALAELKEERKDFKQGDTTKKKCRKQENRQGKK